MVLDIGQCAKVSQFQIAGPALYTKRHEATSVPRRAERTTVLVAHSRASELVSTQGTYTQGNDKPRQISGRQWRN